MDGVYSADPRVVPAARRLDELNYEETQEMAEAGARVLNAQAVEFAKERGIAIYARATAQAPPGGAGEAVDGTVVRRFAPRQPGSVVAVVSEREVLYLSAAGSPGLSDRVLDLLDRHGAVGKQLQVHCPAADADSCRRAPLPGAVVRESPRRGGVAGGRGRIQRPRPRTGENVSLRDSFGAVSAIGAGINASYRNLLRGTACLRAAGIATRGLATSSFRITWLVDRARLDEAVRCLHALYLETATPLVP